MATHEHDDMDSDKAIDELAPSRRLIKDYKRNAKSILQGASVPNFPMPLPSPFRPGPTTAQEQLKVARDSATQAEKQTALLDAMALLGAEQAQTLVALSVASAEQVQTLAAMRKLSEDLAGERRRSAAREDIQQGFNRGMTVLASILAGAAVVVPFVILLIEQALR